MRDRDCDGVKLLSTVLNCYRRCQTAIDGVKTAMGGVKTAMGGVKTNIDS